jgi:hypothetical protein
LWIASVFARDKDGRMKTILLPILLLAVITGCSRPVARMDKLSRVQAAVLTDASGMGTSPQSGALPPIEVTDPDRLAALESFLKARHSRWKKADGMPRPTRFQLQLIAGDRPLYTIWLEPGYAAMASGKTIHETRLSNAESAELMACLGLPPNYMGPTGMPYPAAVPPAGVYTPQAMPPSQVMPASAETPNADAGTARL